MDHGSIVNLLALFCLLTQSTNTYDGARIVSNVVIKHQMKFFKWFLRSELDLPSEAISKASERDFELCGYAIKAKPEQLRQPKNVRIGVIQNKIILPTTAPIKDQVGYVWLLTIPNHVY